MVKHQSVLLAEREPIVRREIGQCFLWQEQELRGAEPG